MINRRDGVVGKLLHPIGLLAVIVLADVPVLLGFFQKVHAVAAHMANCDAGILRRRKDGMHVFYTIVDRMVFDLCSLVCSRLQKELERKAAHFVP